jgi:hypothetical protein
MMRSPSLVDSRCLVVVRQEADGPGVEASSFVKLVDIVMKSVCWGKMVPAACKAKICTSLCSEGCKGIRYKEVVG